MKKTAFGTMSIACALAGVLLMAELSSADVYRYRQSGDWTTVTDGTGPGWGLNPNNDGSPGVGLPGAGDDARINWGNNTVTVSSAVPVVSRVQIGVDESGTVLVENGGSLSTSGDLFAGHNNSNATGTLNVNTGGSVDIGNIFWVARNDSNGVVSIGSGAAVTVANHLWWGVTGTADIEISGTLTQTSGILGLGTSDAVNPGGGTANVTINDGGLLALNNISSATGLPSIQPGSFLDIVGTGELTVPGNFVGVLTDYANANKIGGNGVPGMSNLIIDLEKNPGFTTAYVPEPSMLALFGLAGLALAGRHRRP